MSIDVNIFWTGGYDSTFRMVQLSTLQVTIQPYYLPDNRQSEQNELEAIRSITKDIVSNVKTRCIIKPLIILPTSKVEPDDEITKAYNDLRSKIVIGSQYDWLARFAKSVPGIELCIHLDDKAYDAINKYGEVKLIKETESISYFIIDNEKSSKEINLLFGNMHLPLLEFSKLSMATEYKRLGYANTMSKTWFCFSPIDNKPCGVCNQCICTIEEGMKFRFNKKALLR